MVVVVFLRGVNVGGHRTFRPSILARELNAYDVVSVGAAGTFVVRKPGSKLKFRAALLDKLPIETNTILCDAREILRIASDHPFGSRLPQPDVTRFVSIFEKKTSARPPLPLQLPTDGEWLVRVIASHGQFVFGEYRRDMKTIAYLARLDKLFGARAATRNWNTIVAIVRVLNA